MPTKQLLILANSFKKPDRCIAGLEMIDGKPFPKSWIRPISTLANGGLEREQIVLNDGGIPSVLDVVEIPFSEPAGDVLQPENWFFTPKIKWKRLGKLSAQELKPLLEKPASLWWVLKERSDRVALKDLTSVWNPHSLTLIQPEGLRLKVQRDGDAFNDKVKVRACFKYRWQSYDLSLTDPVFLARHCKNVLATGQDEMELAPPFGDRCALCVSLTPPFQGHHYKVVATIQELPA